MPPIATAVPGIKMGLCNLVIITVLYSVGVKAAIGVSLMRLILVFMLFGANVLTFAYSLAGAFLSLFVMAIMKKIGLFSPIGVSITGAVTHNLGQILVAIVLFDSLTIGYYMLILTLTGTVAGCFIGLSSVFLMKRLDQIFKKQK